MGSQFRTTKMIPFGGSVRPWLQPSLCFFFPFLLFLEELCVVVISGMQVSWVDVVINGMDVEFAVRVSRVCWAK